MSESNDNEKKERAGLLRTLTNGWTGGGSSSSSQGEGQSDEKSGKSDASAARDLLITLITRAGKGKDEVIQVLGREIGAALVALLKQPVQELFKNQRLQITLELQPKEDRTINKNKTARKAPKKKSPPSKK